MLDSRFWSVIASLGPELATARLGVRLRTIHPVALEEFYEVFGRIQVDLDTLEHRFHGAQAFEPAHDRTQRRSWWEPEHERPAVFADLQLTVVAHGLDAWRAVVATPCLMSGRWPTGLGRQLLATVLDARHDPRHDPSTAPAAA